MADSSTPTPQVFRPNPRGKNLQLVAERSAPEPTIPTPDLTAMMTSLQRREDELKQMAAVVKLALTALTQRVLTIIGLAAGASMFAYAVLEPTTMRIAAACLFAVLVFGPLAWIDARRD